MKAKKGRNVIDVVKENYKKKEEKFPKGLRYLITGLNIADKNFNSFAEDFELDPDDEDEVIRFILEPSNSVILGEYGYGQLKCITRRIKIYGRVIDEGNYNLMLK
jgi:hypothetical protein